MSAAGCPLFAPRRVRACTARCAAGVAAVLLVLVMAGCAVAPPAPPPAREPEVLPAPPAPPPVCEPRVVEVSSGADDVLRFYAGLRKRPQAELRASLEQVRKEFVATGSESARIRLAMLYLHPGAPFRSDTAALAMLEPYVRGDMNPASPFRGVAQLLLAPLEEHRRAEATAQSQAARLREEQRRADELQRKLDALMNVERDMILREQNPRKR